MLGKIKKFLKEEQAQGAIEYILLAGGIIVAAVVIFAVYKRMTQSAANKLEASTAVATNTMANIIQNQTAAMNA